MDRSTKFQQGDEVIHPNRPQWGRGVVKRVQQTLHDGLPAQRLEVDFPNRGRVTLNTAVAPLLPASGRQGMLAAAPELFSNPPTRNSMSRFSTSTADTPDSGVGWLAELEGKGRARGQELWALPAKLNDAFSSELERLLATLDTYRYSTEPRALIDWAVVQTGLGDPLSKYTRHELEQAFPRYARDRDQHLDLLVRDIKRAGMRDVLAVALQKAPNRAARVALERAIRR